MNCARCGKELAIDDAFCPKCGKKVRAESENSAVKEFFRKFISAWRIWTFPLGVIAFAVIIAVILTAVFPSDSSDSYSGYSYGYNYGSSYSSGYSDETLELLATSALYEKLKDEYGYKAYLDIDSTRYSIGTIEKSGSSWIVRGTYTLYNKYGEISEYGEKFRVEIYSSGLTFCYLEN